jgi:putative DNA primase/helicase
MNADQFVDLDEARPPAFSDEALALRFAERHADNLRYVAKWGEWLFWDGQRWQVEETLRVWHFARQVCREAAAQCNDGKAATSVASAKTVAAVERLARADRRLAATVDQWDPDIWLLNTPAGVVDLRTGQMRPAQPDDYITNITAVSPGGGCPLWLAFLDRIMGGDTDLIDYIQRLIGYALSGDIKEEALFFGFGTGSNGKGVTIETIAGAMGSYHRQATRETFAASKIDRHPTELADLQGARLVTASETEKGRQWAQARINELTGDPTVKARKMRQDFYVYPRHFKIFITGNDMPGLGCVNEAARRRFHMIPFAVTITEAERDSHLKEKLKAELPGVLAWAIRGCMVWQKCGLKKPKAVAEASDEYLAEEDTITQWLSECCDKRSTAWTPSADLFASWSRWAKAAGEDPGTQIKFIAALKDKGYAKKKDRRDGGGNPINGISGLRLIKADASTAPNF